MNFRVATNFVTLVNLVNSPTWISLIWHSIMFVSAGHKHTIVQGVRYVYVHFGCTHNLRSCGTICVYIYIYIHNISSGWGVAKTNKKHNPILHPAILPYSRQSINTFQYSFRLLQLGHAARTSWPSYIAGKLFLHAAGGPSVA